ncbi:MAG: hypothetical protein CMB77_04675 [Euryarchaeota archaeon]|nr:hypothetical protein [Euryarchaeota archaeon]
MKITKRQLKRIIKEELLKEEMHPLDREVLEIDHNYGKSDAYSYLYDALRMVDDGDAQEAMMEFEDLEQYGYNTEELLDVFDNYPGLKDKVLEYI